MLRHARGEAARRYNLLQQLAYLGVMFVILPFMVLTGLAMSPRINVALDCSESLMSASIVSSVALAPASNEVRAAPAAARTERREAGMCVGLECKWSRDTIGVALIVELSLVIPRH